MFGLILFLTALALPQILGLLLHYRMKRFPRLAYVLGFLMTTILSFYLLLTVLMPPIQTGKYVCGLASLASLILVLFFTAIQALLSLAAQFWFYWRKIG